MDARQLPSTLSVNLLGWFALGFSSDLVKGSKVQGYLCNEKYDLLRKEDGQLVFNGSSKNLVEQNGLILARRSLNDSQPEWTIPAINGDEWSNFLFHKLSASTHPQEIFENSIDIGHFAVVHGFDDLHVCQGPVFDRHHMTIRHKISRRDPLSLRGGRLTSEFEVKLHGMGCTYNTINLPSMALQVKMLVFVTPTRNDQVQVIIGVAVKKLRKAVLNSMLFSFLHRLIFKNIVRDFSQDIMIWENKRYEPQPLLVHGDGQIIQFRRWCQQFVRVDL